MKFDITERVIRHYLKRLKFDVRLMKDGFNEEAIHQFRVEVKKLRAFLRMLKQSGGKRKVPEFPPELKAIYLYAGGIRDRQLCIKRLQKHRVGAGIRRKIIVLKNEISRLKKQVDFPEQKEYQQIRRKLIRVSTPVVTEANVKRFIRKKLRKIKSISQRHDFTDVQLHSVRKWLKDISFVLAILKEEDLKTHGLKFISKKKVEETEKLSQSLGLFNDIRNAISFIKNGNRSKTAGTGSRGELTLLRKNWLSEKNSIKSAVQADLRAVQF